MPTVPAFRHRLFIARSCVHLIHCTVVFALHYSLFTHVDYFRMGFLHLFIVNKSGGLILHRSFGPKAPKIGTNDWLRIGSTFHSLYAIAAEASPVRLPGNKNSGELFKNRYDLPPLIPNIGDENYFFSSPCHILKSMSSIFVTNNTIKAGADDGIEQIEGGGIILKCLQTRTGIKFVLT